MTETKQATITDSEVPAVLSALEAWIKQKPKLDPANYGLGCGVQYGRGEWKQAYQAYQSEVRAIGADRKRAMAALAQARILTPASGEVLAGAFRAFSGRLQWVPATYHMWKRTDGSNVVDQSARLTYCTGQYFPTEYRKAVACVLETYVADWLQVYARTHPRTFVYRTVSDVKEANRSIGNHWFDRSTMRFFNTRVESELIGGKYFITSERCMDSDPRKYTVRRADPYGSVDTVGEFQGYSDKRDARAAIREMMTEGS